ncbi:MAG: CBS domain-containing protein [Chloroflexi bacterium]|nr:CBS domain-containing protein [Chloroflexota bacterium]
MTREVIAIAPGTAVGQIARLLQEHDVSGVPVVASTGELVGIVTESDLIVRNARLHLPSFIQILDARIYLPGERKHYEDELRRMLGTTAKDVMSSPAKHVAPGTAIEDLATMMVEERINPVPVVENGVVVGIVSRSDLVRLMVREEEQSGVDGDA